MPQKDRPCSHSKLLVLDRLLPRLDYLIPSFNREWVLKVPSTMEEDLFLALKW